MNTHYVRDIELYDTVKTFAMQNVYPSVQERDKNQRWDKEIWHKTSKIGLQGILIPQEYGGQGGSCLQLVQAAEAFCYGGGDGGLTLSIGATMTIGTLPIIIFGTEEQKKKYLPKIASGEYITSFGLTEASSGSDAASMLTTAKLDGDHYILNGSKMFITNGPIADLVIVTARTQGINSRNPFGISTFILETKLDGFSSGKPLEKMGMNTSKTSELIFDNIKVPKENLLGELHYGFSRVIHKTLEWERSTLSAMNNGFNSFLLDKSLNYAKQRNQFGQPIINYFAIQSKIVKIWLALQNGRRLVQFCAELIDRKQDTVLMASITKLVTTDMGEDCCREAIQILGGWGYMKEYDVERIYRDSRLGSIGGGTSEIMHLIIGSSIRNYEYLCKHITFLPTNQEQDFNFNPDYDTGLATELSILQSVGRLVRSACVNAKQIRRHPSTILSFSYAVCLYVTLYKSYLDSKTNTDQYTSAHKKRDFVLLTHYLVGKYLSFIKDLVFIDEKNTNIITHSFLKMKNISSYTRETTEFLENLL